MKVQVGDITSVTSGVILHQVNCQGVMGSGVAAAIRRKWPIVFSEYRQLYDDEVDDDGANLLGRAQLVRVSPTLVVFNLFAQQFYGRSEARYTSYDFLDEALLTVHGYLYEYDTAPSQVHHPQIGCGLGGGHWPVVRELIEHRLGDSTTLWLLSDKQP